MADFVQTLGFNVSDAVSAVGQLDNALAGMEKRLDSAANALNKFNQAGAQGGEKGAAAAQAEAVNMHVANLQKLYSISSIASAQQQRAYQSAITSAAEFAVKNKISMDQVAGQAGNLSKNYTGAANVMADKLSVIDRASQEHLDSAGRRVNGLAVTWQTMVRVVTTQLIVRAMSTLRNALEGAVTAAIGFETHLAEIQTIGGPAAGSLKQLGVQMKGLSEEFAKPLEDVTEGYYMILSNQIGDAADSFLVARESAKLATAAVSSFADAANALSSIINSYKMHASDANDISGKLFATVEMGRLRLSDIANTLGRVTVLGHEVGVSLDEVLASLATLTISGVKPDEAMTLLSNAMRGLLKPTKDMKKAFDELGVANAEVGIATYGFQGFLEKLRGTTNGTASEIAKLTQNIRVGRGVIGLTGEAVETYQKNLDKIRNAGGETANAKAQLILDTNAQQVQREFVSLRNFFVNDFGVAALKVIKDWIMYFGGLVNVVRSLRDAAIYVGGAFAAWKLGTIIHTVITAMNAAKTATLATAAAVRVLGAATFSIPGAALLMLAVGAFIAWTSAGNSAANSMANLRQNTEEALNAAREANAALAAAATIDAKKVETARTKVVEESIANQLKLTTELQKLYKKDMENAQEAQTTILANLKSQLSNRLSLISKLINDLERKQDESKRVIDKNKEETSDLKLQDQERFTDRQIARLGEQEQAVLQLKRARDLQSSAEKLAQSSDFKGSEELLKTADQRAVKAVELGETQLKEAKTVQDQQIALSAIQDGERELKSILQQRLALREQENKVAKAQADAAKSEISARQAQLRDAKALVKEIEGYEAVGKKAGATEKDQLANREKALSAVSRLEDVLGRGDVNLEQFLGIQELSRQIRGSFDSAMTDKPVSLSFAFKEGIDSIIAPLEAHKFKFKAQIEQLETATGAKIDLETGYVPIELKLREQGEELKKAIADISEQWTKKFNLDTQFKEISALATKAFNDPNITKSFQNIFPQVTAAAGVATMGKGEQLLKLLDDLNQAQSDFAQRANVTVDTAAKKSLSETAGTLAEIIQKGKSLVQTQEELSFLQAREPGVVAEIGKQANAGDLAAQALQQLQVQQGQKDTLDNQYRLRAAWAELPTVATAAEQPVTKTLNAISDSAGRAAEKVGVLSGVLDRVRGNVGAAGEFWFGGGEAVQTKALGGLVKKMRYFESGGAARGTDNIPAMLSKDEVVTDARNSRRFLPQLQAIGAGVPPAFEPGAVTNNTTVGDIIVNGAQQPKMVAREIMSLIRREERRGSSRL